MLPDQSAPATDAADCSSSDVPSAAAATAASAGEPGRSASSSSTAGHMPRSAPQDALKGPQPNFHAEPAADSVMGVSTPGDQDASTSNAPSASKSHGPCSNGRGLTDNERKWRALHAAMDAEHTGGRMLRWAYIIYEPALSAHMSVLMGSNLVTDLGWQASSYSIWIQSALDLMVLSVPKIWKQSVLVNGLPM